MTNTEFIPDWIITPGELIKDTIEERQWTQKEFAERMGYTEKHISQLLNDKAHITSETATRLSNVFGNSVQYWLNVDANYQKHKARLEAQKQYEKQLAWVDSLPIKSLMQMGAIEKQKISAQNKPTIIENCLKFFGVASAEQWQICYANMTLSFRKSTNTDIGAISAWLRLGEKYAEQNIALPPYNKEKFIAVLQEIREMTCQQPEIFSQKMQELLAQAGVILVFIPAIRGAKVSGVARWLSPTRPLIQLSLYGKTNDKFWFTFFHEAAHILLHKDNKQTIFIDGETPEQQEHEEQANQWARTLLIPEKHNDILSQLRTKAAIQTFALQLNLHPAIVLGRLQFEGHIPYNRFNELKASYKIQ